MAVINPIYLLISSVLSFFTSGVIFKSISTERKIETKKHNEKPSIFDGFKIIFSSKTLTVLTIGGMLLNFFFAGLNIYIVLIAKNLGSSIALGGLNAGLSVGTIIGATYYGHSILKGKLLSQKLIIGTIGFGISILFASLFLNNYFVIAIFIISGISLGVTHIVLNPIIQNVTSSEKLGRVFSAKYTVEVGIMPLASLFFGKIAQFLSMNLFFIIFGGVYIAVGGLYYFTLKNLVFEKKS
jgi:MFS family permease